MLTNSIRSIRETTKFASVVHYLVTQFHSSRTASCINCARVTKLVLTNYIGESMIDLTYKGILPFIFDFIQIYKISGLLNILYIPLQTMPSSALMGQNPISVDDELIHKALLKIWPPIFRDLASIPHNSHHSRAPSMIIGASCAITLIIFVTCARLWVRFCRTRMLGADDITIIAACVGCVVYLSMLITTESIGCLGRHIYNCTYKEVGYFYEVSEARLHKISFARIDIGYLNSLTTLYFLLSTSRSSSSRYRSCSKTVG